MSRSRVLHDNPTFEQLIKKFPTSAGQQKLQELVYAPYSEEDEFISHTTRLFEIRVRVSGFGRGLPDYRITRTFFSVCVLSVSPCSFC